MWSKIWVFSNLTLSISSKLFHKSYQDHVILLTSFLDILLPSTRFQLFIIVNKLQLESTLFHLSHYYRSNKLSFMMLNTKNASFHNFIFQTCTQKVFFFLSPFEQEQPNFGDYSVNYTSASLQKFLFA